MVEVPEQLDFTEGSLAICQVIKRLGNLLDGHLAILGQVGCRTFQKRRKRKRKRKEKKKKEII